MTPRAECLQVMVAAEFAMYRLPNGEQSLDPNPARDALTEHLDALYTLELTTGHLE